MDQESLAKAQHHYMVTALWASTTCVDEVSMDSRFTVDDISSGSQRNMSEDVQMFIEGCEQDRPGVFDGMDPEQIGHDFWLTRNHHGAGFWDRGLGEVGDYLTKMAHPYGDAYLWDGEDGRVYYQS